MAHELRIDQTVALDGLREAIGGGEKRICMKAPTGWGKTLLSAEIVQGALSKDKRVLFTVPMISLVDQTVEMLFHHGIKDIGVIQARHHMTDWSQPVQVASVQTLMKRELPRADVVMLDECHRWYSCYEQWLSRDKTPQWGNVPVIGLSATPWTKGLANWFAHLIVASTTQELIDQGVLAPFKVYAPTHVDLSGIKITAGDYNEKELSEKMSEGKIVGDVVDTWLKMGENRPTLCYAVDRAHAKHLQLKFQAAGVPCGYQDAFTKDHERKELKRDFHSGALSVVCNVGTLTTGIDWDVRCISMVRPTKSDMLFVQIVGRGLRKADGKDHCLILDHSDNHSRLGFVTDVDASHIGLRGGKTPDHENRTDFIRLPKECPQCHYLKAPKTSKCPACGFVATISSSIKALPGELRELKKKPKVDLKAPPATSEEKLRFYAELKFYGFQKGYNPHWADNQYRERMGMWPGSNMRGATPTLPSASTLSWIRHRMIAYAKSKHHEARPNG